MFPFDAYPIKHSVIVNEFLITAKGFAVLQSDYNFRCWRVHIFILSNATTNMSQCLFSK